MDPISAAIFGASSLFGGMQANRANKANERIAMLNYYEQRAARQRAEMEAMRQRSDAQLGTTDASGNRTRFVPGVGVVTELSPQQERLRALSEQEAIRQAGTGAERNERVEARANRRRNEESGLADAAQADLRGARRRDLREVMQQRMLAGQQARNEQADRSGEMVSAMLNRTGASNDAAALRASGRATADAEAAAAAAANSAFAADDIVEQDFARQRDAASSMYDYFRRMSTSGTAAPTPYMPQGPEARSTGLQDQALLNIMARAPQQMFTQPNLALSDTASDLATLFMSRNAANRNSQMDESILNRQGRNVFGGGR